VPNAMFEFLGMHSKNSGVRSSTPKRTFGITSMPFSCSQLASAYL